MKARKPWNNKMLEMIDDLKASGEIRFRQEFLDKIGMEKQNFRSILLGTQSFTVAHIQAACKVFGYNANWVFGLEKNKRRRLP